MRISTIVYEFKQGFKNIGRNFMFSLASIVTMAACIFLFGVFFSIVTNVNYIVKGIESDVAVTVFFDEGAQKDVIASVREEIEARSEVSKVTYTSPEEAWENFQEEYFEGSKEAAEGFKDDNPLANSASLEVYVNDIETQTAIVEYIRGLDGVREVNQSEAAANTLGGFNKLILYVSIAIIAILLIVAIFLISNTVSIGISIRKEEIGIMKLIGATNVFVRAPFLLEGVILGFVGAAIPLAGMYFGYDQMISYVMTKFQVLKNVIQFVPVDQVFMILLPVGLALGVGIGLIASWATTRRHLKV